MSKDIADRFRRMADRIEKNGAEPFGGAALIVAPGDGDLLSVELLKLDPKPDAAMFWGEIRSKADEAVAELSANQRMQNSFRR